MVVKVEVDFNVDADVVAAWDSSVVEKRRNAARWRKAALEDVVTNAWETGNGATVIRLALKYMPITIAKTIDSTYRRCL